MASVLRAAGLCLLLSYLWCVVGSLDPLPVDPYAYNYDHNSQTNKYSDEEIQKLVESECSKLVEDACIKCSEEAHRNCGNESWKISPPNLPLPREKDDEICDSVVFRHLVKGIAEAFSKDHTEQVVITLDSYRIERLHKFLWDESEDIPSVDIVHMVATSLSSLPSTAHYSSSWFERTFSIGFIKAAVCLGILVLFAAIFKLLLTGNISLIRVVCALVVAVLIINFAWSYMLLYQKKIAERMADDAQRKEFEEVCQKNLTGFQKFKGFFGFHIKRDERCQKFIESFQIDPLLEVHPIEAITDTFERIITSLSGAFGKSLGNFNEDFFSNVSLVYWIPAMFFNLLLVAVVLAVYLYCGRRHIVLEEVRNDQGRESYGRNNDGIEEPCHARIEPKKEPSPLQLPALQQLGEFNQGDQSDELVENSGMCSSSSATGGLSFREDGGEVRRRRKLNEISMDEHTAAAAAVDKAGEGDCNGKQKDSCYSEIRTDKGLGTRVQDLGAVKREQKLGTSTEQNRDVRSKLKNDSDSNRSKGLKVQSVTFSQNEVFDSGKTKEDTPGMNLQADETRCMEQVSDEDFVVLPEP